MEDEVFQDLLGFEDGGAGLFLKLSARNHH